MLALLIRYVRLRQGPVWAVVLGLAVLRVGETHYGSPAIFPLPTVSTTVPAGVSLIQDGAVLDLPIGVPVLARSKYGLDQLVHMQPIPYGLNDPIPRYIAANYFTRFLFELESSDIHTLPSTLPWLDLELGREAALTDGLRWIVLHEEDYPEATFTRVSLFLDLVATPVHHQQGRRIYRLDP
jgi:hypothetical protein